MFVINVKEKGKRIETKYRTCISPCTLKFQRLTAFQECLEYLKKHKINYYTTKIEDRHPIRRYDNSSKISLNGYIGGRP